MPAASKMSELKRKRDEEDSDSSSSEEESITSLKMKQNNKKMGKDGKMGKVTKVVESDSSSDDSSSSDSDSDSSEDEKEEKKVVMKKKTEEESAKKKNVEVKSKEADKKAVQKPAQKEATKPADSKKSAPTPATKTSVAEPSPAKKTKVENKEESAPAKKKATTTVVSADPKINAWREAQNLTIQGEDCPDPYLNFEEAPFPDYVTQAIKKLNFKKPTPIQSQAWPLALAGRDMVGLAETGSGKTLAFMLPAVVHTCNKTTAQRSKGPSVLVLAPTRELAQQIESVTATTCGAAGIKSVCVYGGVSKQLQEKDLKKAEVIIATPGRLLDFMNDEAVVLSNVTYLVLDEADRMLDMGFELQINSIMRAITSKRQTLMFSATWPNDVQRLSQKFFTNPIKITIGSETLKGATRVTQIVEVCTDRERNTKLKKLLEKLFKDNCRIMIFMLYKKSCSAIAAELEKQGWPVGCINGDMSQNARNTTLAQFKDGTKPIMVATDVAARGLDIKEVKYVINVEFPLKCEDYVHRIGRTGRAGEAGTAYTFFTENEKQHAKELLQILKESGQNVSDEFLALASNAPGIKPKKTVMEEMYGDFAKGKNMAGMANKPTRIVFD